MNTLYLRLPNGSFTLKAAGFDVDGVLRDTGYPAYQFLCHSLRELKAHSTPTFSKFVRDYSHDLEEFCAKYGVICTTADYLQVYRRYSDGHHDSTEPFLDVLPTFQLLHLWEMPIFVVSSHNHDAVAMWLETHGLNKYVGHISGSRTDKADAVREACDALGTDTTHACYIGDWGADMHSAIEAKAIPLGITRGHESREALMDMGAAHVFDHLPEFTELIGR